MDELEVLLEQAAMRDSHGNVAVAQLRREDQDAWDTVVVAKDLQPLRFWTAPGAWSDREHSVVDERGRVLACVASTPPGVTPAGFSVSPCTRSGSPLLRLVAVVDAEGETIVGPSGRHDAPPPEGIRKDMLHSLMGYAARRRGDNYAVGGVKAASGGPTNVLLDWDNRVLMCWLASVDEPDETSLYVIAATSAGPVAVAVDEELRPIRSNEELDTLLGGNEGR